jgi:hypothetical protein
MTTLMSIGWGAFSQANPPKAIISGAEKATGNRD